MRTVQDLIDEAARLCGGQSALADRLGVSRQRVSEWRHGKRALTATTLAALLNLTEWPGEEARELLALIETEKAPEAAREALRRAFFVLLGLGVALAPLAPRAEAATTDATEYTSCSVRRMLTGAVRWLSRARRTGSQARGGVSRDHGSRRPGLCWLHGLHGRFPWGCAPYPAA